MGECCAECGQRLPKRRERPSPRVPVTPFLVEWERQGISAAQLALRSGLGERTVRNLRVQLHCNMRTAARLAHGLGLLPAEVGL
jgi:hypothetical protein